MHTMTKPDASKPTAETLVARARAMIPVITGRAAAARRGRRVPAETILDMEAAGFFRILQPARWGGYEMKPQVFYDVLMALAEGDMSTGWVYGVLGVHPWLMGLVRSTIYGLTTTQPVFALRWSVEPNWLRVASSPCASACRSTP